MISKNDIIQTVRRITKKRSGAGESKIMHPERDWAIGLSIAAVLFILSVGYTGYEFLTHLEEAEQQVSVDTSVVRYDQETVAEVLERYGAQERRFETLRADRSNAAPLPLQATTTSEDEEETDAVPEDVENGENEGVPEIAS